MSLVFNDTSTKKGIVQIYEKEIGAPAGFVSGNTDRLKDLTADVNLALDEFTAIALKASGTWQYDDSNHTDYPIITGNLVSGQRDYPFVTDESGNLILDIYKVLVADSSGVFSEIKPKDAQSETDATGFTDGRNTSGIPIRYDKTANGIFLDPIPNYNYTNGLKIYINRESSYFTYTDTTKKPGVPGTLHRYFAIKPAADHARRNNLVNAGKLEQEVIKYEGREDLGITGLIGEYFSRRMRDEKPRLSINHAGNSCKWKSTSWFNNLRKGIGSWGTSCLWIIAPPRRWTNTLKLMTDQNLINM